MTRYLKLTASMTQALCVKPLEIDYYLVNTKTHLLTERMWDVIVAVVR